MAFTLSVGQLVEGLCHFTRQTAWRSFSVNLKYTDKACIHKKASAQSFTQLESTSKRFLKPFFQGCYFIGSNMFLTDGLAALAVDNKPDIATCSLTIGKKVEFLTNVSFQ